MPADYLVTPIGFVRSPRLEVVDDHWGGMRSTIELDADRFGPEALVGLDGFSHAEVVYLFDRVAPDAVETGARHPRGTQHRFHLRLVTEVVRGRRVHAVGGGDHEREWI